MKSEALKTHSDEDFRRATGVRRGTFAKMAEILAAARVERRKKRDRKPKLSPEETLLAMLAYLREYRTYAPHCGQLRDRRKQHVPRDQVGGGRPGEERRLLAAWEKGPAERRHGLRGNPRGRDGNAY